MTKRAIRKSIRSGTKKCAICDRACPLVAHHIHGREVKDADGEWNIAAICPTCHDEIHLDLPTRIIVIGWYMTTGGRRLVWHRKNESAPDFGVAAEPPIYGKIPYRS